MTAAAPRGRSRAAAASGPGSTPFDLVVDFSREQLTVAMDMSGALLRGVEAMRAIQQRAAQEAATRHLDAARGLRAPASPVDLLGVPFALAQADLAAANRYWQDLAAAALEAQTEMLGCACADTLDTEAALAPAAAVESIDALAAGPASKPAARRRRSRRTG